MSTQLLATYERAQRLVQRLRARVLFRGCRVGRRLHAARGMRVVAAGAVVIGDRVFFLDGMLPAEVLCRQGASLSIGDDSGFNYGVSIEAQQHIVIGRRCMFGAMSRISDVSGRHRAPVVIGDDVWVGHGAIIEPGVTVGNGSVISAGSVVTSDVPALSMAIGNPARAVRLDAVSKVKA